jgi:UPF0755 protein
MRPRRAAAVVLLAAALAGAGGEVLVPYRGFVAPVDLEIPAGADAAQVSTRLGEAGVIRSPAIFRMMIRLSGTARRLQAGEYRFQEAASALGVLRRLLRGDVLLHRVTIPEGLRREETIAILVAAGLGDEAALEAAARDPAPIADLDPRAPDLEGYLFPDTYHLPRGAPPRVLLATMVDRFREVFGPAERRRAAELRLSVREAVTLASLVEKEAALADERPLVAAVFHNRLRRGMLLQCDPTVIYALVRRGGYDGRLTREALRVDSPYNTYLHAGLPPGPIASPGAAALRATLHPADAGYLYFVARNDGSHHFSTGLQEHERAVDRYQRSGRASR